MSGTYHRGLKKDPASSEGEDDYILPPKSSCWIRVDEYEIHLTTWLETWAANIEVFTRDDEGDLISVSRIDLPEIGDCKHD